MVLFARCGSCKVKKVFSDGICQFDKTGIGPFIVETSTATSHTKKSNKPYEKNVLPSY